MKEINVNEKDYCFYAWHEDEEIFYEMENLSAVEFNEDIMEVTEIKEIDYELYTMLVEEGSSEPASYEVKDFDDGDKLSVTMFKILMQNKEIISLPVLTDERAEFVGANPSHGSEFWYYDEDGKREATDDEIDNIED